MKKYILKDGKEIRGVEIKGELHDYEKPFIVDLDLNSYEITEEDIERVTFVKNIDKELRKALEEYKVNSNQALKKLEENEQIIAQLEEENLRLRESYRKAEEKVTKRYKEIRGVFTPEDFISKLENLLEDSLRKGISEVSDGISSASVNVFTYGDNFLEVKIPVDIIRWPQPGDWNIGMEYDQTLYIISEIDMSDEVKRKARGLGLNVDLIQEKLNKTPELSDFGLTLGTSLGDKSATLRIKVRGRLDFEKELKEEYLEELTEKITAIFS